MSAQEREKSYQLQSRARSREKAQVHLALRTLQDFYKKQQPSLQGGLTDELLATQMLIRNTQCAIAQLIDLFGHVHDEALLRSLVEYTFARRIIDKENIYVMLEMVEQTGVECVCPTRLVYLCCKVDQLRRIAVLVRRYLRRSSETALRFAKWQAATGRIVSSA